MKVIAAEPNDRYSFICAETYGDLIYLSDVSLNPFESSTAIGLFSKQLDKISFDPDTDVICLTGKTIIVSLLMSVVAVKYNKFKVLMFDARVSAYRERTILIKGKNHGEEKEK